MYCLERVVTLKKKISIKQNSLLFAAFTKKKTLLSFLLSLLLCPMYIFHHARPLFTFICITLVAHKQEMLQIKGGWHY